MAGQGARVVRLLNHNRQPACPSDRPPDRPSARLPARPRKVENPRRRIRSTTPPPNLLELAGTSPALEIIAQSGEIVDINRRVIRQMADTLSTSVDI